MSVGPPVSVCHYYGSLKAIKRNRYQRVKEDPGQELGGNYALRDWVGKNTSRIRLQRCCRTATDRFMQLCQLCYLLPMTAEPKAGCSPHPPQVVQRPAEHYWVRRANLLRLHPQDTPLPSPRRHVQQRRAADHVVCTADACWLAPSSARRNVVPEGKRERQRIGSNDSAHLTYVFFIPAERNGETHRESTGRREPC